MNNILNYANSLGHPYKYDSFKEIIDNTNKIKFYILISKKEENLYLGWPTIIKETDGIFSEIKNNKEKLKIMNLPKVQ